jgi:hypothetical protein
MLFLPHTSLAKQAAMGLSAATSPSGTSLMATCGYGKCESGTGRPPRWHTCEHLLVDDERRLVQHTRIHSTRCAGS